MQTRNQIVLLIIGMAVGLLGISQYQAKPLTITTDKFTEARDQEEILEILNKEQNLLKTNISSLREKLNEIQSKDIKEEDQEAIQKLKERIGLVAVAGPGVQVILNDSLDVVRENLDVNNDALVHASDLRDVINLLRVSQAEAISINGQRILINSPISCVGNSILVNNSNLLPPFQIEAVGDASVLITQLENNLIGIHKRTIDNNLVFKVERKDDLSIPIYNGDLGFQFTEIAD